jgi:hypothetical protein
MRLAEATMPKVADQLQRLGDILEVLVAELRMQREARADQKAAPAADPK